jgi:hypothetical protein
VWQASRRHGANTSKARASAAKQFFCGHDARCEPVGVVEQSQDALLEPRGSTAWTCSLLSRTSARVPGPPSRSR